MSIDLDAIRQRAEAATPGPWESGPEIDGVYAGRRTVVRAASRQRLLSVGQTRAHDAERAEANVEFAAHAREDIPALLDEIDRLRPVVDAARAWRKAVDDVNAEPRPLEDALVEAVDALDAEAGAR